MVRSGRQLMYSRFFKVGAFRKCWIFFQYFLGGFGGFKGEWEFRGTEGRVSGCGKGLVDQMVFKNQFISTFVAVF